MLCARLGDLRHSRHSVRAPAASCLTTSQVWSIALAPTPPEQAHGSCSCAWLAAATVVAAQRCMPPSTNPPGRQGTSTTCVLHPCSCCCAGRCFNSNSCTRSHLLPLLEAQLLKDAGPAVLIHAVSAAGAMKRRVLSPSSSRHGASCAPAPVQDRCLRALQHVCTRGSAAAADGAVAARNDVCSTRPASVRFSRRTLCAPLPPPASKPA